MRLLLSRWSLSLLGTLLLSVIIWLFAPLIPGFDQPLLRLALVAVLLVVWGGANALLDWRARRRDKALYAGMTGSGSRDEAISEETAALNDKLATALALFKRARGTRGYLYEQPWYVIIGPPGAGKTTALLNAGLKFPLAAEMGQAAVAGTGGTRLCEWWFTDDAVLIDTAGRYTTQDSDAEVDRAGWESFLSLLKQTRPRQPLNGVIVAIAVNDIAQAAPDERLSHARAIRRRVKELETKLGIRMPIYAVFTKADLLAGFTEFFDDLDRARRSQVWGTTFALAADAVAEAKDLGARFASELRLMIERLNERLIERLQTERSPERRALIVGFPSQVASLEQPLASFLQDAFGGSRLDPAPLLRGAYLTSGTQEGTPIDRLAGYLARSFGLDQQRAPTLRAERGRSYFLGHLLTEVILGETMLVSEPPGTARRRLLTRIWLFGCIGLATLALGVLLYSAKGQASRQIELATLALDQFQQSASGLPIDPIADGDLARLVPVLDAARALPFGPNRDAATFGWLPGFGMNQRSELEAGARATYRHGLQYALLPRLLWRLEAQMRGGLNRPDFLYEATRVYLMLGGAGPLDRDLVREWMTLDWRYSFRAATQASLVESLHNHLDALLAEPLPQVALDAALVEQARATFSRVSVPQRVYSRIRPSAAATKAPGWTPLDALGPAGGRLFIRPSGKLLSDGVPGFLTPEGFQQVLLPALPDAIREVSRESWVLGKRSEFDPLGPQVQAIGHAVIELYAADYIRTWDAMLADLEVVPMRSLPQAAQDLYILSSPQSPMRDLLTSIAGRLSIAPPAPPAPDAKDPVATAASTRLRAVFDTIPGSPAPPALGSQVNAHFKPLRDLVAGGQLDQVLKVLGDLQQQLAKLAAAPIGATAPTLPVGNDPALALRVEAERQPAPLSRWLTAIASTGSVLRGGGARQQVAAAFNGAGGPATLCPMAVNGRFPFTPGAGIDTPLADFGKLFAPGGLLDGFFNTQLRPYVDTAGRNWVPQSADGVPAPVSPADVLQFQLAAVIRDLFFAGGGTTPTVRFDITPVGLDNGANQVILDLDGTQVINTHGPTRSTQVLWPGPNGVQNVRLVFDPPPPGKSGVITETGPWAMFRLFARGDLQQGTSSDIYRLTFQIGERRAVFDIRAGSVLNPFAPGLLQQFRCPTVQ
ncbi:MAG: type VI secretion system membrane subunit TssM [Rhodospirillales bacterium]|nr:type VI secretion system membrane subunit TssM [Rhodospirillales bacterium]